MVLARADRGGLGSLRAYVASGGRYMMHVKARLRVSLSRAFGMCCESRTFTVTLITKMRVGRSAAHAVIRVQPC
eukprot:7391855-Prymnesium_polylepis.1